MAERRIDKAVILAAGLGNRISAVSKDTPKPLLSLDGKPGGPCFLDWHLRCLAAAGAKEIYLVGNNVTFGRKLQAMDKVKAEWILNPSTDLSTSGSGHSAWYAWHSPHNILDGKSRVVLMDADIAYDPRLLAKLAAAEGPKSKTLVCGEFRETNEEVLVYGQDGQPRMHGKGLSGTPMVQGLKCMGEATGILLFEPGDHAALAGANAWIMRYGALKPRAEHEDVTQLMMHMGRMEAVLFGSEHLFMECDTPEEYRVLTEEMYPKLAGMWP